MRLRNAFWILVMLAAPAFVLAQETQPSQPPKPPEKPAAEAQKAPEPPAPAPSPAAKLRAQFPPAPKPGHPLDPADVDVLTGKNKSSNPYGPYGSRVMVDPYSGFGYPMGGTRFDQSVFSTPGGSMLSGQPPFVFGDVSGRRFSLWNGSRAGMPILFFNHGTGRSFIFLGRGLSIF
jgi:hypothetical protein